MNIQEKFEQKRSKIVGDMESKLADLNNQISKLADDTDKRLAEAFDEYVAERQKIDEEETAKMEKERKAIELEASNAVAKIVVEPEVKTSKKKK